MRNISDMTSTIRRQTSEIVGITERLRSANRRFMGGTGQAPTQLNSVKGGAMTDTAEVPPLLVALSMEIDRLETAGVDLINELTYLEGISETGGAEVAGSARNASNGNPRPRDF